MILGFYLLTSMRDPYNVVRVDGISSCLFSDNLSDIWSRIRKRYRGWGYCRAFFTFSTRGQLPLTFQDSYRAFCLSCNLQHFAPLTMYFIYRQHISQNLILILTFQWCFTLFVQAIFLIDFMLAFFVFAILFYYSVDTVMIKMEFLLNPKLKGFWHAYMKLPIFRRWLLNWYK